MTHPTETGRPAESGAPHARGLLGESGQTMAEYGVVLTVLTAGIMLTLGLLGGTIAASLGRAAEIVGFAL